MSRFTGPGVFRGIFALGGEDCMEYSVSYDAETNLYFVYRGERKVMRFAKKANAWIFIINRIGRKE
jgi:hypothetical protein